MTDMPFRGIFLSLSKKGKKNETYSGLVTCKIIVTTYFMNASYFLL
mgnify:CR=1 FL=1